METITAIVVMVAGYGLMWLIRSSNRKHRQR